MKDERENFANAQKAENPAQKAENPEQKAQNPEQTEQNITSRELTREILPLLKEYFVAKCRLTEDGISMRFPNGQCATVAVWFSEK